MFGRQILEVTDRAVRVLTPGGAVAFRIPIKEIKSARNEPLVGGGRLLLTTRAGECVPIISYSLTLAARFSEAARGIEQLARGEPLLVNLPEERLRCARCLRLLPEKDGVCPACVDRNKTFRRILSYLHPYRRQALLLTVLAILQTLVNLVPPQIQGAIIDGVLTTHKNLHLLFGWVAAWLGVVVVSTCVQIGTGRLIAFLAGSIAADLRASLYRAIEFLQVSYFDKR